ncbi:hypothetical protein Y979_24865 (plasmid) [Escherichia coli str. Sanji]|nr:hypothetical protein Y979_24865 [Escherichia coli str. Sanji]
MQLHQQKGMISLSPPTICNSAKPIGKEYIFQELVNPIHNRKDNQVTVSLTVEYIDQQTKATQVSQFDLVLEKNGSNWKIVK